ncbi:hypothetical protein REH65_28770 [Saccharopolyspora sp. ID03-671]|uniref:hypothetical protein n=1 Tax=Saccharopolyspora sp. ID03-671 TaxID=3073066 RepID=UPI0032455B5F
MTAAGFDPEWLALREPADAAARAAALLDPLRVVLSRRQATVFPELTGQKGHHPRVIRGRTVPW